MTDQPFVVEQPGVYLGLSDADYHRDPVPGGSLSSTGARKLLPPSCPALYRHWADNPQPPKKAFDLGHAAHELVLGMGMGCEVVPGDRWDTKAAKEKVAEIRARGAVPLKQADMDRVEAMAAKLREHPLAGKLLQPGTGEPEASLFWQDPETGVWCRVRTDWLPHSVPGRRLVVADYKTTDSVAPDDLARSVYRYGYHVQEAFYTRGIRALGLADDVAFVFVWQMKEAPYLVSVTETDDTAKRIGEQLVDRALAKYRDCTESGHWPSFDEESGDIDVITIASPRWAERAFEQEF